MMAFGIFLVVGACGNESEVGLSIFLARATAADSSPSSLCDRPVQDCKQQAVL